MPQSALTPSPNWLNSPASTLDVGLISLGTAGLSLVAACGVLGNLYVESGLTPSAHCIDVDGQQHVGLPQWSPQRRQAILFGIGIDVASADAAQQFRAILFELHGVYVSVGQKLSAAQTPQQAAQIFNAEYEVSADASADRENAAEQIYQAITSNAAWASDYQSLSS